MSDVAVAAPAPPTPDGGLRSTDFLAAQRRNRRSTAILLLLLTTLAGVLGYLAGAWLGGDGDAALRGPSPFGLLLGGGLILASLAWSGVSLLWGDRMVLAMTGGEPATRESEPQLFNVVEEMALASGLPVPQVRVLETDAPNAFATGMRPDRAVIGVTRGLLDTLNREELQGVVAHEMSHIANLDSRYLTVVGVTVGLIALVSDMILRSLNWGGLSSNRSSRDRKSGGGAAILLILLLVVALLAPLAATLVQFAVSRQREYLADATAVQFTRNPEGLIGALRKLAAAARPFPGVSQATQHLFIVNPLREFTKDTPALLATHPDIEDRIARLRALG
jgi:heat shock protein HtpX